MPARIPRIEDYALIGDLRTAALVSRAGSIDWLCLPRFDSPACFAALLGDAGNGRWRIAPRARVRRVERRYGDQTLILATEFEADHGRVRVTDFMALPHDERVDVVRIVEGLRGTVPMRMDLRIRFDYGRVVPWVRHPGEDLFAVAGPDALRLSSPLDLRGRGMSTVADFEVRAGQRIANVLTWYPSWETPPPTRDAQELREQTEAFWRRWCSGCRIGGPWRDAVERSAIVLKALTDHRTGGIVAAATTSLPERLGGRRNWDYRYCWLRDATFVLLALMAVGSTAEAGAWQEWLIRAAAGEPDRLQIMYGVAGERRLDERELPWLAGFAGSRPVRVGNAAYQMLQLDVYGEIMDALHVARTNGLDVSGNAWDLQVALMAFLERHWRDDGAGMWERRGPPRRDVHSAVMAWVAADRTVKAVERFGLAGPAARWRRLRDRIHREVCERGFNRRRGAFTQTFGGRALDAALLLMPVVGFLPADDPRVVGTVEAIQRELVRDGFVLRYRVRETGDGVPGDGEGTFLACTLWLADNLTLAGRRAEARQLFERVLAVRNDVGLLAEEYDPRAGRQLGNFPQAYSHVGIINTAHNLMSARGPAHERSGRGGPHAAGRGEPPAVARGRVGPQS